MSDFADFLFLTEEPMPANIGAICAITWALYLTAIMMRRLWHRHQRHIDDTVMAVVRREICKEYGVMLQRIHTFHRESIDVIPEEPRDETDERTPIGSDASSHRRHSMWSVNCDIQLPTPNARMNKLPIALFPRGKHNKEHTDINVKPESIGWDTLHRDVNTFVEFEQLVLLTEIEDMDILHRSMMTLRQRIWFRGRDPERRIHTCLD